MGLAAIALGLSVFLSRILGLVRDKIISYYFGTGAEADIYFTAFVVPDFLNYLLAGGYFSITLVPLLSQAFGRDEKDAWHFFSAAVCWATLLISLLTLIAWLAAPAVAPLVAPGFSAEAQQRLAHFLRIILPAQACFLPGACFTALLYMRRQFAVPALSPLVYNGCIILFGVAAIYLFPSLGMEGFCWGVLVGAALGSLALPVLAVRGGGLNFAPRLVHKTMKKVLLLALPLMLGQSIVALDEQFVRIFGSLTGEGGVSMLNYARRIMLVPVGVVAQAAGLASYPFLASLAAAGEKGRFDAALNSATNNTLLVALPLSLWMLVAAEPIMRFIFQQGDFSVEAATQSGLLLAVMMSGVAFWAVQQLLGRAFYAHQDTLTPALVGSAATLAALPLYWFGATRYGSLGVALAGVIGVIIYTAGLCLAWQRRFGADALAGLGRKSLSCLALCLPASLAARLALKGLALVFPQASLAGAACKIACSGLAFGLSYLALAFLVAPHLLTPLLSLAGRRKNRDNNCS
ncbi:murein biosynthesis integral membrane protein MurJ [Desulfovibrio sp. OttesenSCG-928-F20]|nr:murein biosynthesis integral membrane protein MurJ [Desulfovibrio sp. OttesenSCG-928-F20]